MVEPDMPPESGPISDAAPRNNGRDVAAILLMLLDEADAAAILRQLDPDTVRDLGVAMLGVAHASEGAIQGALQRFIAESRTVSTLAAMAEPRVRSVMSTALGSVRADNILAAIAPRSSAAALDRLRWMETGIIAQLLADEHPQVGAIILAVLTPEVAAAAMEGLDEAHQADLVWRAARLESVSAEAIADLDAILAQVADQPDRPPQVKLGGRGDIARLFNTMKKPAGERVLKSLKKRDRQLGQAIEDEMFVFDDLNDLDGKALGAVLRSVDAAMLGLALKGADAAVVDRMLGQMSARAAQSIRDDMAERGLVKRADVEEAQKAIVTIARQLAADGTIMLGGAGDDYV